MILLRTRFCFALAVLVALTACADLGTRFIRPYRVEIQQGNFITAEQVAALRENMTREQVRFVLGTPTLQDVFHANRWDYPFYIRRTTGEVVERKLVVFFENDRVTRWQADEMPVERRQTEGEANKTNEPVFNPADVQPDPPSSRPQPRPPAS
ncbi:MAG TPA: outer membrane protein assembly factor BamE [Burkholderiaceae bacterium]|nr:outer membrane protein assembly factor BamE [Burkholderiaceae bacterium]